MQLLLIQRVKVVYKAAFTDDELSNLVEIYSRHENAISLLCSQAIVVVVALFSRFESPKSIRFVSHLSEVLVARASASLVLLPWE